MPKKSVKVNEKAQATEKSKPKFSMIIFFGRNTLLVKHHPAADQQLGAAGSAGSIVLSSLGFLLWFDSLSLMSCLHLQFEAVWRKAIQKAFAACFARMLSWQLSCAKTQQHISAFPYGSKPYFCSCSLRSDTILCVSTSHSDTTLNLTPVLSSVTSHAKGKHKGRLRSPLFLSVGGIFGCHCGLLRMFSETGIPEQSWAWTLLQTCYRTALSVAVQFTMRAQLLSNPQILDLHHLGQMTAVICIWDQRGWQPPDSAPILP